MTIQVGLPDAAAASLMAKPVEPVGRPGTEESIRRTYKLVGAALFDLAQAQWIIVDKTEIRSAYVLEPVVLERFEYGFCVYAEQRGVRTLLAVMKDYMTAADYFVWVVSEGRRKIDWAKFLDMNID